MTARERIAIAAIFVAQLVCLAIAASHNSDTFNPDAVAYLQVARHILAGQFSLAVTGYWGPLLSWICVPLLAASHDPLLAARGAMIISALVFSGGSFVYFNRSRLPFVAVLIATAACAFASVYWSVAEITPDLLADGFLLAGFGLSLENRRAGTAGLLLGIAYLAKAVMLPVGIATVIALAVYRRAWRAGARTLVFLAIVALPWIAILTIHYGRPLFSTAGPIAHALVGPPDVDRRNPIILSFRHPAAGRVVDSEDPDPARFHNWSPFASGTYAQWQIKTMRENLVEVCKYVDEFAAFHLAWIALLAAIVIAIVQPRRSDDAPSLVAAVPLLIAAGVYAPVFAQSKRYFIFAYPLILGAAAAIGLTFGRKRGAIIATTVLAIAIVISRREQFVSAFSTLPNPSSRAALDLAGRMRSHNMIGPIAGVAPVEGGMGGLYTAFFLDVPWCGDDPQPRITTLRASNARYWIVGTDDRDKLKSIPTDATRDVTPILYGSAPAPFVVREVIR